MPAMTGWVIRHCGLDPQSSKTRKDTYMGDNAYVYFMTNQSNSVLYVGVTNNLERRVWEHRNNVNTDSFTSKYKCHKLVYCEHTNSIRTAIEREKQLKNWKREWKNELIGNQNPDWIDLSLGWYRDCGTSPQ